MDGFKASGILTQDSVYNSLVGIGWIVLLAGMLVVGILVIAAKTWRGWQRFIPLLTPILVPVGFGIGDAIGNRLLGVIIVHMGWLLLGFIIATTESASTQPQVPA